MVIIINDDPVYLSWVRRHRSGFVIDTKRKATKRNTALHRASCAEVRRSKTRRTHWTTAGRVKACSEDRRELMQWAAEQIGGEPKCCEMCLPASDIQPPAVSESSRQEDHHLTRLENDIVSCVVESAVIHLDNDLDYRTTVGDVARYLSKTPAQISSAVLRLVSDAMLEIAGSVNRGEPIAATSPIFPTAHALCTVPAFAELNADQLQRELDSLHA